MLQNNIWEKIFQRESGKYPAEHLIRFVAQNYYGKDRQHTKILEVGCGPGANIWYMSREGFHVYGIDGSPTGIRKAKERLDKENLKADLIVGDIIELPYQSDFFDAVIDNECLYSNNWQDSDIMLLEIKRVMKTNGLFFSRSFSTDMYIGNALDIGRFEYKEAIDGVIAHTGFLRLMDRQAIYDLYGEHFKIVSIDKMDYSRNNEEFTVSEWIIICTKFF